MLLDRMLDWDDLRVVLAVARGGTLSAAARALAVTQPTVGRRIDAFERAVGGFAQCVKNGVWK